MEWGWFSSSGAGCSFQRLFRAIPREALEFCICKFLLSETHLITSKSILLYSDSADYSSVVQVSCHLSDFYFGKHETDLFGNLKCNFIFPDALKYVMKQMECC